MLAATSIPHSLNHLLPGSSVGKALLSSLSLSRSSLPSKQQHQQQQATAVSVPQAEPTSSSIPSTTPDEEARSREGDFLARQAAGMVTAMFQGRPGPGGFLGKSEPALELEPYMFRMYRYAEQWAAPIHGPNSLTALRAFSMAMELLSRLQDAGHAVCRRSAHRLMLVAVLVSLKCTEDFVISNRFWAKVGGIPLEELNELELDFCKLLHWNLAVSPADVAAHREKFVEPCF